MFINNTFYIKHVNYCFLTEYKYRLISSFTSLILNNKPSILDIFMAHSHCV